MKDRHNCREGDAYHAKKKETVAAGSESTPLSQSGDCRTCQTENLQDKRDEKEDILL